MLRISSGPPPGPLRAPSGPLETPSGSPPRPLRTGCELLQIAASSSSKRRRIPLKRGAILRVGVLFAAARAARAAAVRAAVRGAVRANHRQAGGNAPVLRQLQHAAGTQAQSSPDSGDLPTGSRSNCPQFSPSRTTTSPLQHPTLHPCRRRPRLVSTQRNIALLNSAPKNNRLPLHPSEPHLTAPAAGPKARATVGWEQLTTHPPLAGAGSSFLTSP
eukprot:7299380-Pyramimonas_sp.AAC.1